MPMARPRVSGRSYGSSDAGPGDRVFRGPGGLNPGSMTSVFAILILAASLLGGLGASTPLGQDITNAVIRFLLFYAGVLALIGMTTTVGLGLVATDRIIMSPGRRVVAQAVHRAVSLGTLAFLIIHIWLEIEAQRSQVADSVVPFLALGRTFYVALGTIASDLIVLIVITGFLRPRFAVSARPWVWRAIHASAYISWVFSIIHGLLAGRTAKPYVDWSYGGLVAAVALALGIRMVAKTRSREEVALATGEIADNPGPGWQGMATALTQAEMPQLTMSARPPARASLPAGPSSYRQDASGPLHAATGPLRGAAGPPAVTGPLGAERRQPTLLQDVSTLARETATGQRRRVDPYPPVAQPLAAPPARGGRNPDDDVTDPGIPAAALWDRLRQDEQPRPAPAAWAGEPGPVRGRPVPAGWADEPEPVRGRPVPAGWADEPGPVRGRPVPAGWADEPGPVRGGSSPAWAGPGGEDWPPRPGDTPGSVWDNLPPGSLSRPVNAPGSVWTGPREVLAEPPQQGDPWGRLRSEDEPWDGEPADHPYPRLQGQHHRRTDPGMPPRPGGRQGDLPRRNPRIAHTYGGPR